MSPLRLALAGAAGRTGRRVVALAARDPQIDLVAALTSPASPLVGGDAGEQAGIGPIGLPLTSDTDASFDVLVDFTTPRGTLAWLARCRAAGRPLVVCTTGHAPAELERIEEAAEAIPILAAPNASLGFNALLAAARSLAGALGEGFDAAIVEVHHRAKRDAPSGSAKLLAEAVRTAQDTPDRTEGPARPPRKVPVNALRLGGAAGEHALRLVSADETIELLHRAHSRDPYARGALRAARWLAGREPGLYRMEELLRGERGGYAAIEHGWRAQRPT